MEFYENLFHIEKRPKMYFSEVTTLALESFLTGFWSGHHCDLPPNICPVCNFREFNGWIQCRLHSSRNAANWRTLLLEKHNDQKSFEMFFHYLHEFINRKFITYAQLPKHNLSCSSIQGGIKKHISIKSEIYVGKYTDDPGYWLKINGDDVCHLSGFYRHVEFIESFLGIARSDWNVPNIL